MVKSFPGEQWKNVKFDFDFINDYRLEVSNLGRLRTFNKLMDGDILNGTTVNGYRIVRLKFYKARDAKVQRQLNARQKEILVLSGKIKTMKSNNESKKLIKENEENLASLKKDLHKKFMQDTHKRTINYHALVHRLVAAYFLKSPSAAQTIVAHLDFNKMNNRSENLKWMTPDENYTHQQKSPYVIQEKKERKLRPKDQSKSAKLTVTKVMLLKKLLNQGKPMKQLVKQFKITDTQILRIKRGENWGEIKAAD